MPVPPGVLGKKLCRLGEAHPRSLKLTSWIRLLRPVMTLWFAEETRSSGDDITKRKVSKKVDSHEGPQRCTREKLLTTARRSRRDS